MFTGIVESIGVVDQVEENSGNRVFTIRTSFLSELKSDQSLSHNGVCLTVEQINSENGNYQVTAIAETLEKTMLGNVKSGDRINLERSLAANARVDGHFVQGHVDTRGNVIDIITLDGSWEYFIEFSEDFEDLIVPKGSICVNGISLTVVKSDPQKHFFSVCIIPYTHQVTNIGDWKKGDPVNIEFDVLGKYVKKIMSLGGKSIYSAV